MQAIKVCLQKLNMQIVSRECGNRTGTGGLYNIRYRYNLCF